MGISYDIWKRYGVNCIFSENQKNWGIKSSNFFPFFSNGLSLWSRDFLAMDESPAEAKEIFEKLQGDDSMVM
jgi:hypothetical protein